MEICKNIDEKVKIALTFKQIVFSYILVEFQKRGEIEEMHILQTSVSQ